MERRVLQVRQVRKAQRVRAEPLGRPVLRASLAHLVPPALRAQLALQVIPARLDPQARLDRKEQRARLVRLGPLGPRARLARLV